MTAGTRALIKRIRSDIASGGDEQLFNALWRQLSPEDERLVDYLPCGEATAPSASVGEHFDTMPAWQILKVLLAQSDASKIY